MPREAGIWRRSHGDLIRSNIFIAKFIPICGRPIERSPSRRRAVARARTLASLAAYDRGDGQQRGTVDRRLFGKHVQSRVPFLVYARLLRLSATLLALVGKE